MATAPRFAITIFFLAILNALTLISVASAHGTGASFERTIDGYLVDIGYSPEEPKAGEQTRFDFYLYDAEADTQVPFTDIWFRIEDGNRLLLAGGLAKATFGTTGITYAFPEAGTYTGFVRFSNDGKTLVETEFELPVGRSADAEGAVDVPLLLGGILLGLLCGGAGTFFYLRRTKSSEGAVSAEDKNTATTPAKSEVASGGQFRNLIPSVIIGLACAAGAFYVTNALLADRAQSSTEPTTSNTPRTSTSATDSVSVVLTESGYEPSELTVTKGTTVTFSTVVDRPYWPASNPHPTHDIYSEFDPGTAIPPDQTWDFTFDRVGSWNMHDHLRSYYTGTIRVVE